MAEQYIFTMLGLNKFYGQKQVLRNVNLSFFPGAKIGIVGENGSGKSTVLKIMAGLDDAYQGTAKLIGNFRSGIVMQEPLLDETATVRTVVEQAFGKVTTMMNEYNDITAKMGDEMADDEDAKADGPAGRTAGTA